MSRATGKINESIPHRKSKECANMAATDLCLKYGTCGRVFKYKGYEAMLYGSKSMVIAKDGKVVLHTGFRDVETVRQVHELIDYIEEEEKNEV